MQRCISSLIWKRTQCTACHEPAKPICAAYYCHFFVSCVSESTLPSAALNILSLAAVQSQAVLIGWHKLYSSTIGLLSAAGPTPSRLWNEVEQAETERKRGLWVFLAPLCASCRLCVNERQCLCVQMCEFVSQYKAGPADASYNVPQLDCDNFGPLCHMYGHSTERLHCDCVLQGFVSCLKLTLGKKSRDTSAAASSKWHL